jgi:tRNA(Ile)-lysidine synthase
MLSLEIQVRKTIRRYGMLSEGEHVVVAVSGGADSTALLLCLQKLASDLGIALTAAHLNHRIRGTESDADEEYVREMCAGLELPFTSEACDIKDEAIETKQNLEQLARRKRYDFLRRTAIRLKAQKIAVGHNRNDQAETVLFRLLRGAGIQGMSAIRPVLGGVIVRPLLECSRDSILEYLKGRGVAYREDSTNKDFSLARNRIRHELLPFLEKQYNPGIIQTLSQEAAVAREAWSFIESESIRALGDLGRRTEQGLCLEIRGLLQLHPALQKQVLRSALESCLGTLAGITARHIESLHSLCLHGQSGTRIPLPHRGAGIRQFNTLWLSRGDAALNRTYRYGLRIPGEVFVSEASAGFKATVCGGPPQLHLQQPARTVFLEAAGLPAVLTIRSREHGDRYGGAGHRKVKKMLIDHKIPLVQRGFLPMVVAGTDVVWVPGFRPARAYEAKPGSETYVMLEFKMGNLDSSQQPEEAD